MGRYPLLRRRRFFVSTGLQGRFVAGLAVITALGLSLNIFAAYYLIERRLGERLYKIHLQANSTLDIIWPAVWKLSVASALVIAIGGVLLAYVLARRLEAGLRPYLKAMKDIAGGDLGAGVQECGPGLEGLRGAFNNAVMYLRARFSVAKTAATRLKSEMDELNLVTEPPGATFERDELRTRLEEIISISNTALKEISKLRV